ncbi:MAG: hypothetical protein KKC37_17135 [Proteobacteria bacterium]|nr:hypothetical protein [Pseudomonadota bacterium]
MLFRILRKKAEKPISTKIVADVTEKGVFMDESATDSTKAAIATGEYLGVLDCNVTLTGPTFTQLSLGIYTSDKKVGDTVDLWKVDQILTNKVIGYPVEATPSTGAILSTTPVDTQIELFNGKPRILQTGGHAKGRIIRYVPVNNAEFMNEEVAWHIELY